LTADAAVNRRPDDIAYYISFGPADTAIGELVRVAGSRWPIEEVLSDGRE
jgi:SRSO17 transposase